MKASASLTVLEMLVYLNPAQHFKYLIFSIEFDAFVVKKTASRPSRRLARRITAPFHQTPR